MIEQNQPIPFPVGESKDNQLNFPQGGDHDEPYKYLHPTTRWTYPFTERQFARLLVVKSRFSERNLTVDAPQTTALALRQDPDFRKYDESKTPLFLREAVIKTYRGGDST